MQGHILGNGLYIKLDRAPRLFLALVKKCLFNNLGRFSRNIGSGVKTVELATNIGYKQTYKYTDIHKFSKNQSVEFRLSQNGYYWKE